MQTCSRCGTQYDDRQKFCTHDGTPLDPSRLDASLRRCPRCAAEFVGARFCPHDGMPMELVPEGSPPAAERR
jgi:NADH pyrophosphatase NudC (nudix superfamily)